MKKHLCYGVMWGLFFFLASCEKSPRNLAVNINWQAFMANHDLVWDELPFRWENAPFLGNGLVGGMLHISPDSSSLKLLLCRSDIGKLDYPGHFRDPNRLQLGAIELPTNGKILSVESALRLNLWDAAITGKIKTTKGFFNIRSFAVRNEPMLVVETFDAAGEEAGAGWIPHFEHQGKQSSEKGIHLFEVPDRIFHERSKVKSGGHVIAWKEEQGQRKTQLRVSINSSPSTHHVWNTAPEGNLSAREGALLTFANTEERTADELFHQQAAWWHDFYPKSFVSFGNKEIESYYWIQLYKMASSSRKGYPMIDNHGVWSVEPVYGFATWDLNVQIIYRLHLAANHLELGEPLLRFLETNYNPQTMYIDSLGEMRAGLRQQTFLRYTYFDPIYWEHDKKSPCDGAAKFLWGCHNYWLHFQYAQDSTLLPKLKDMLEGGINAMKSGMELENDGKWHIPYGHSWETWRGKDPNAHLAVLNWALETLISLEKEPEKLAYWQAFKQQITEFVVGEKGYMLGEGKGVKPHRHWSHLLHLYPLRTVAWEDNPTLYQTSVDAWADISTGLLDGVSKSGYAPSGALCMYAQMGNTARIDSLMDIFLYAKSSRGPNVWASTMYREYGPVIETPLFFAASMQELFLQAHQGTVKVFPAMASRLGDVAFHRYRAEGGFLVSAKYANGKTVFVAVESLQGNPLRLETSIEQPQMQGSVDAVRSMGKGVYQLHLNKGEKVLLFDETQPNALTVEPVESQFGQPNTFGLNARFYKKRSYLSAFQFEGR